MKISIIPHLCQIHNKASGYNKRIYHLAEGLAKRGHQIKLFAYKNSIAPKKVALNTWLEEKNYLAEINYLSWAVFNSQDCDIINLQTDHLGLFLNDWSKKPLLHTIIYGGKFPNEVPKIFIRHSQAYFSTISNFIKNKYHQLNWQGVVHNGVDLDNFSFNDKPKQYALCLARITPEKNIHLAAQLAKKYDFPLIIAGEIKDKAYFKKEIKKLLNNRIKYLGKLNLEKKIPLLQKAAFLLHLNKVEGFGNSVIEALACGTPVIGFNSGGLSEIIDSGQNGLLIKSAAQFPAALKKIDSLHRENCRKQAEKKFSLKEMVNGYEKLYKKIVNQA